MKSNLGSKLSEKNLILVNRTRKKKEQEFSALTIQGVSSVITSKLEIMGLAKNQNVNFCTLEFFDILQFLLFINFLSYFVW